MNFFEDVEIGTSARIGAVLFTPESIKAFATEFDPQPFHMDEEAAKHSHFGALCASGWHTASAWMRCMIDYRTGEAARRRAAGEPTPKLGPSPGFQNLRWLKPVYAGDTVTYHFEITEKRRSASKPGWGIVFSRHSGINQHGQEVFAFESSVFVETRS